jgi:MFS family permease
LCDLCVHIMDMCNAADKLCAPPDLKFNERMACIVTDSRALQDFNVATARSSVASAAGARRYEIGSVALLSLVWGIVNFEMLGIYYVMPFISASLALSNTQAGILVSSYWVPFALSSYLAGEITDRLGKRKPLLQMGVPMSVLGVSNIALGALLPAVADRVGHKQVAVAASIIGVLCPLAAIYYSGSMIALSLLMFVGWAPTAATTLFLATIPSESVPERYISTTIGLVIAVSTLVGGAIVPALAGWGADRWGLRSALLLAGGCAAMAAAVSLGLHEHSHQKGQERR